MVLTLSYFVMLWKSCSDQDWSFPWLVRPKEYGQRDWDGGHSMDLMKCWCGVIFGTSDLQKQSPIIFLHLRFGGRSFLRPSICQSASLPGWVSPQKTMGKELLLIGDTDFDNFFPSFPARMLISSTLFGNAAFPKPLSRLGQWGSMIAWIWPPHRMPVVNEGL